MGQSVGFLFKNERHDASIKVAFRPGRLSAAAGLYSERSKHAIIGVWLSSFDISDVQIYRFEATI